MGVCVCCKGIDMDMIAGCMCDLERRETEMCVTERGKEGEWEAAGMVRGSVIEENSRWKGAWVIWG